MANPGKPRRVNISSLAQSSQHQWLSEVLARRYGEEYVTQTQLPLSTYWRFNAQRQDQDVEILYHTKLMGRLNLCDGRDSLYSLYLKEMFRIVGKHHVIVVVDDVSADTTGTKQQLLQHQSTLSNCRELFVFRASDCKAHIILEFFRKLDAAEGKTGNMQNVHRHKGTPAFSVSSPNIAPQSTSTKSPSDMWAGASASQLRPPENENKERPLAATQYFLDPNNPDILKILQRIADQVKRIADIGENRRRPRLEAGFQKFCNSSHHLSNH
uniref:Uncharacterized LOC103185695 n=1 Tax=Callorhinchus milii TaxID=7868 RepID=A0A4W3JXJ0_CALMI|eukprot:gi/632972159/ref/XP_007902523.1/ PREDICTED: uncharacterized protein LOC103185695 isoform X1 [Callorhinchus milii]